MVYPKSTLGNVPLHVPVRGFRLKVKRSEGGEKLKKKKGKDAWMGEGREVNTHIPLEHTHTHTNIHA